VRDDLRLQHQLMEDLERVQRIRKGPCWNDSYCSFSKIPKRLEHSFVEHTEVNKLELPIRNGETNPVNLKNLTKPRD